MPIRPLLLAAIVLSVQPLDGQQSSPAGLQDPLLRDVVSRAIGAAGGPGVTSVQSLSESGQITFHWAQDVTGRVVIDSRDDGAFRMDANLPEGKRTIVIKDGKGSDRQGSSVRLIPPDGAANFCHLTFPIGHVIAAFFKQTASISSFTLDNSTGTPAYRLRVEEHSSTIQGAVNPRAVKELVVDAMTFDVLRVEDYGVANRGGTKPQSPSRVIEYGDYRTISGIRVPYLISTMLQGQRTVTIRLDEVKINANVVDSQFSPESVAHP